MSLTINYFNQYIDLIWKSMDCFIYDRDLHHERVTKGSLLEQGGVGGGGCQRVESAEWIL